MDISAVQHNFEIPTSGSVVNVTYASAQTVGNLNIVVVGFSDITSTISSVADSSGNAYAVATALTRGATDISQAVYYCSDILDAGAGSNIVTVTFSGSVPYPDIRISEFSGILTVSPIDVTSSVASDNPNASTGVVMTTNPHNLLFAAGTTLGAFNAIGPGYILLDKTSPDGDVHMYKTVNVIGNYDGSGTQNSDTDCVMQLIAFKAADNPTADYALISEDGLRVDTEQNADANFIASLSSNNPELIILPINWIAQPSFDPVTQIVIRTDWTIGPVDVQPVWSVVSQTSDQLVVTDAQAYYDSVIAGDVVDAFSTALAAWGSQTPTTKDALLVQLLASMTAVLRCKFLVEH